MWTSKSAAVIASTDENGYGFRHMSTREAFALLLIVVAGTAARLHHIGWQPLWTDEGFSEWASRQSVWYLWSILPTFETNPPLYYTLLKGWRILFGDSEAALRSLSALFGVATIPLVFAMGRMLGRDHRSGAAIGLLAAAMFALSPIHIQYAQEARAYAVLVFGVALAMTGVMWLMLNRAQVCAPADQAPPGSVRISQMLGLFALGMALIMWSHDTGALAVLAIVLPVIYWWFVDAKCCPRALVRLLIAGAIALALFLPYLGALLSHTKHVHASFWIKVPDWSDITTVITRLFGTSTSEGFTAYVVFLLLAVFAVNFLWQRGMRSVALLLVSVGLFPIVLEVLVSYLAMPVFLERTLIYVNIPLYVAAAYGLTLFPVTFWRVGGVVMLGMLVVALSSYFKDFSKEPWNEITSYLSRSLRPGQPVLLVPAAVSPPLEYYAVRQGATFRRVGVPADWPEPSYSRPAPDAVPGRQEVEEGDMGRVTQLIMGSQRVALLMRREDIFDPNALVMQDILKTHIMTQTRKFGGITVIMFSAPEGNDEGRGK
jgi:mannosyltransferase